MSTARRENETFPFDFQGTTEAHRILQKLKYFSSRFSISPDNLIPWKFFKNIPLLQDIPTVKKKRELFPGQRLPSRSSFVLPQEINPQPGIGILTNFPFDRRRESIKT